jgi:hypothetical protein
VPEAQTGYALAHSSLKSRDDDSFLKNGHFERWQWVKTTHFCHSRFSKAASRPKPDSGTGGLQSSRWRPQPNGQELPPQFQLWLAAIKCIPAFQLAKIVGQNKQMGISRNLKFAGNASRYFGLHGC